MVISRHELLQRNMSGSVFLLKLGSMMMSMTSVTKRGNRNHACMKKSEGYAEMALPLTGHCNRKSGPFPHAGSDGPCIQVR